MTTSTTETANAGVSESSRYIQIWVDRLAEVLEQISGSPIPCAVLANAHADSATSLSNANDMWILGVCSGGPRGEMSLLLPSATVLRLAQIFMNEPAASEAALTPDHREATVELLRQVAGLVTSALKTVWGEVQLRLDVAGGAPSWPSSATSQIRIGDDATTAASFEIQLSAALVAALRIEKNESAKATAIPSAPVQPGGNDNAAKLDLLMDVELAVTLRFGSRSLLLREVLDLSPGAVVDLDRQVEEPVDVLLDGRLVARGEVVVMDGNYGVRVTEVAPANR